MLTTPVKPEKINGYLVSLGEKPLNFGTKLTALLLRPHVSLSDLIVQLDDFAKQVAGLIIDDQEILTRTETAVIIGATSSERNKRLRSFTASSR